MLDNNEFENKKIKSDMKKMVKYLVLTVLLIAGPLFIGSVFSQPLPTDPTIGGGTAGSGPIGGCAPIGSGLIILMALGAGYGTKKIYDARKRVIE